MQNPVECDIPAQDDADAADWTFSWWITSPDDTQWAACATIRLSFSHARKKKVSSAVTPINRHIRMRRRCGNEDPLESERANAWDAGGGIRCEWRVFIRFLESGMLS